MKPALWTVVAIGALAAGPSLAAQQPPTGTQGGAAVVSQDRAIDKQIDKAIKADPALKHSDIHVAAAKDGVVTLTGTVTTAAEKERAGALAKQAGANRVDNQIIVDLYATPKGTSGEKAKDAAEKAGDKTKDAAEKVGEKTKEGASAAGNEVTDAWILSRVKSRFVGVDVLKGSDINVDVDKHVVTLKGTVPSEAARARAISIAKSTEGVHSVDDRLVIGSK